MKRPIAIAYSVKYAEHRAPIAAYGIRACANPVGESMIADVVARRALLPVSATGGAPNDSILSISVFDPGGRPVFQSRGGAAASPYSANVTLRAGGRAHRARGDSPARCRAARPRRAPRVACADSRRTSHADGGDGAVDGAAASARARAVAAALGFHLQRLARAAHAALADHALRRDAQPRPRAHRRRASRRDRRDRAGRPPVDAPRREHPALLARRAADDAPGSRADRPESRGARDRRRLDAARGVGGRSSGDRLRARRFRDGRPRRAAADGAQLAGQRGEVRRSSADRHRRHRGPRRSRASLDRRRRGGNSRARPRARVDVVLPARSPRELRRRRERDRPLRRPRARAVARRRHVDRRRAA